MITDKELDEFYRKYFGDNFIPDWFVKEREMPAPVNRQDIVDDIKNLPKGFFDLLILYALTMDTEGYDNPKPVNDLKDKIERYLGFAKNEDGVYIPRVELNKEAKDEVNHYIAVFESINK